MKPIVQMQIRQMLTLKAAEAKNQSITFISDRCVQMKGLLAMGWWTSRSWLCPWISRNKTEKSSKRKPRWKKRGFIKKTNLLMKLLLRLKRLYYRIWYRKLSNKTPLARIKLEYRRQYRHLTNRTWRRRIWTCPSPNHGSSSIWKKFQW